MKVGCEGNSVLCNCIDITQERNNDGDNFDNSSTDTKVRVGLEQVNSKTEYSAMFGDKH